VNGVRCVVGHEVSRSTFSSTTILQRCQYVCCNNSTRHADLRCAMISHNLKPEALSRDVKHKSNVVTRLFVPRQRMMARQTRMLTLGSSRGPRMMNCYVATRLFVTRQRMMGPSDNTLGTRYRAGPEMINSSSATLLLFSLLSWRGVLSAFYM
jgi:hypothetical protein